MQVTGTSYLSPHCTISWPHSVTPSLFAPNKPKLSTVHTISWNTCYLQIVFLMETNGFLHVFFLFRVSTCVPWPRLHSAGAIHWELGQVYLQHGSCTRFYIHGHTLPALMHSIKWHKMVSRSYVLYISLIYALHYARIQAMTWHYITFHYIDNNNYTNTYYMHIYTNIYVLFLLFLNSVNCRKCSVRLRIPKLHIIMLL